VIRLCRGLRRIKPILSSAEGDLWRVPDDVVAAVRESEDRGDFDQLLQRSDPIVITKGVLASVQAILTDTPAAAGSRSCCRCSAVPRRSCRRTTSCARDVASR
jgi:hypothetical protein